MNGILYTMEGALLMLLLSFSLVNFRGVYTLVRGQCVYFVWCRWWCRWWWWMGGWAEDGLNASGDIMARGSGGEKGMEYSVS